MNIQALRYILQISQIGSISKAAQYLYVSQPTLSRAVHEIEESTGIILFQRTNKGVVPTYDGRVFIAKATQLLDNIDNLQNQYFYKNTKQKSDEATLLIGSQRCSPVVSTFINFYHQYCEDKDYQNLAFQEGTREEVMQLIFGQVYHIGIVHYLSTEENSFLNECDVMGLNCYPLDESPICIQVREEHPLADKKSVTLDMLVPYPHVVFSDEDVTGINYCSDILQYNKNVLKKRIVVQDRGTIRQVIDNTNGYYLGNDMKCNIASSTNLRIKCIPLANSNMTIKTVYICRENCHLSDEEKKFVEALKNTFRNKSQLEQPVSQSK